MKMRLCMHITTIQSIYGIQFFALAYLYEPLTLKQIFFNHLSKWIYQYI